jgi:hypothetical protein
MIALVERTMIASRFTMATFRARSALAWSIGVTVAGVSSSSDTAASMPARCRRAWFATRHAGIA